jgi:hypothetical protein
VLGCGEKPVRHGEGEKALERDVGHRVDQQRGGDGVKRRGSVCVWGGVGRGGGGGGCVRVCACMCVCVCGGGGGHAPLAFIPRGILTTHPQLKVAHFLLVRVNKAVALLHHCLVPVIEM